MKLWLSSSEIADLALPGLPTTRQNVVELAKREDWGRFSALCRQRSGRGGGLEYHVNLLPVAARVAYFGAEAPTPAAGEALQAAPEPAAGSTSAATLQLDARLAVLGALRAFIRSSEMKQTLAISYFVDLYNLGKVEVPAWAARVLPRLSTRTVLRWLSASREGETSRLAVDRGAGRRGQGVLDAAFDGEIKHFAVAVHSLNDLYTTRQIYGAVKGEFGARLTQAGISLPGQRAFEVRFNAWKQEYAAGLLKMMDPDGFRSKMKVSGSYAHLAPHLNALWQIDASPVDAMCVDGRHSIYVCIDYWSRRIVLFVSKTPRSEAVQLLMRKAILAWGAPDAVKTDNGSDFVARATVRLFARLQIEAIRSDAFSPWQKGVVERNIRTFQTDCARMLPGFVGHNVAQRKKIEGRKAFSQRLGQENDAFNVTLTGEDLQQICDHWAADIYAHHEHGGIGKMTPFARAASSTRPIRSVDADALAALLMQAPDGDGYRTVGKSGVRVNGFHYQPMGILPGERVFVMLDPADKGTIWLFADETLDRPLGRAVNGELAGVDPTELQAQRKAMQTRMVDEQMAEAKAMIRSKRVTDRTVLDHRLAQAALQVGNLVAFPPRSEPHSTAALEAGAEVAALRRGEAPRPAAQTPEQQRLQAEIEADLAGTPLPPVVTPLRREETPAQRFRRAHSIEAQLSAGEVVTNADALWLGGYQASAEYRAQKTIAEDFGEAALR
ncbi:MAG: DDE-type integrase/transposase/recombinase [Bosea sp.]|uniref:DNA-binding protein n=1 Tax=Bosea sp. (in: a-proteobacteria) TaxID=1871050 RepID=UPI00239B30F2|nr:DDE-type integrase/transposase/recombinase [Bosea sp. (in: a-proteobacteria)]MCP4734231.1 DDE-type integrase/transposase/recombinase [Bosea sp. (in: a-proteobacteria)]